MPTFLVTGASRGLGVSLQKVLSNLPTYLTCAQLQFAFLKELSADRENLVVGLVRNKLSTERKIAEELGSTDNIRIVEADITNYDALNVRHLLCI
jgi:NAD(P)-dependent dehydrogenase (short-subunit alcohol dehydrogenase family)